MRSTLCQALVLAATVAGLLVLSGAAAGGTAQRPVYQLPQSYYLALGDSMAYGFQPSKAKPGARASAFRTGYVDGFAAKLVKLSPGIRVVNYGCPGETTATFIRGGWNCDGAELHNAFRGSQLAAATAFLRAHRGEVSPITLTLWGNDVYPLTRRGKQARPAISAFAGHFSSILRQLRAAAPDAEIIVTGAWNPEADRIQKGQPLYRSVDAAITRAAAATGARVAEMFSVFDGAGDARAQQHRLCALTFYCSAGGDPHPTDAGYRAMAKAFLTASGYPRTP